jgi:GTP-binding protein Era
MTEEKKTRAGFVALIGAPNAGKSTLLNAMIGSKIAIVTPKVQTTRTRVLGIAIEGGSQLIFVDTPGIFNPKRRLDRAMVAAAWASVGNADEVVLLVDSAHGLSHDVERIVQGLKELGPAAKNVMLALNKVDAVEHTKLLKLSADLNEAFPFRETFMISALTGDGVADLKAHLAERLPEGPWLYPEDQLADIPQRTLAAEITREKLFLKLRQELPYAATVETESWKEQKDGSLRLDQVIYVQRQGHKGIILGKGGAMIKSIGAEARSELEQIFGCKVHLFLFVKVREHWADDPERYRAMGLDYTE